MLGLNLARSLREQAHYLLCQSVSRVWAMVVAQLTEKSLLTPEIHGSAIYHFECTSNLSITMKKRRKLRRRGRDRPIKFFLLIVFDAER